MEMISPKAKYREFRQLPYNQRKWPTNLPRWWTPVSSTAVTTWNRNEPRGTADLLRPSCRCSDHHESSATPIPRPVYSEVVPADLDNHRFDPLSGQGYAAGPADRLRRAIGFSDVFADVGRVSDPGDCGPVRLVALVHRQVNEQKGPLEPWFNKTWKPGEFELQK